MYHYGSKDWSIRGVGEHVLYLYILQELRNGLRKS